MGARRRWWSAADGDHVGRAERGLQVAGGAGVEIGTTAHMVGTILAKTAIHLRTGASLNGRALAQTAVTLDKNKVVFPGSTR